MARAQFWAPYDESGERGTIHNLYAYKRFKKVSVHFVYSVFDVKMQFICTNVSLVCRFGKT